MYNENENENENENLVITRKRKKWKFAHFRQYKNCFDFGEFVRRDDRATNQVLLQDYSKKVLSYFAKKQKLTVEIAAGNAQFSLELARRHPDQNFIAIDIKADRLYTSAKSALEENLNNIIFIRLQLAMFSVFLPTQSVDKLWLTFPDPRPKKGDHKQRLTHPFFLSQYEAVLKPGGELYFKTDNQQLFDWSLEQFDKQGWYKQKFSRNLHASNMPEDYKIMTQYEQKYSSEGSPTFFIQLSTDKK